MRSKSVGHGTSSRSSLADSRRSRLTGLSFNYGEAKYHVRVVEEKHIYVVELNSKWYKQHCLHQEILRDKDMCRYIKDVRRYNTRAKRARRASTGRQ